MANLTVTSVHDNSSCAAVLLSGGGVSAQMNVQSNTKSVTETTANNTQVITLPSPVVSLKHNDAILAPTTTVNSMRGTTLHLQDMVGLVELHH